MRAQEMTGSPEKKAYAKPVLERHGSVQKLTERSASDAFHQKDSGSGISFPVFGNGGNHGGSNPW